MKQHKRRTRIPPYEEFCVEMDLMYMSGMFPTWVEEYRYRLLTKLNPKLIKFCRKLKAKKVEFSIMFPMEINKRWKFADIYIPSCETVVMVTTAPHPAGWLTYRAAFFKERCEVYELDGFESEESLNGLIERLKRKRGYAKA